MLFDMEDYRLNGVIGQNQVPMTAGKWTDVCSTSRAARDAFFKAVGEWYFAANICPEGTCTITPQILYAEYLDKRNTFITTQNNAWDKLENSITLTRTEYDNYVSELKSLMKTLKKLFIVLEGGKLKKV